MEPQQPPEEDQRWTAGGPEGAHRGCHPCTWARRAKPAEGPACGRSKQYGGRHQTPTPGQAGRGAHRSERAGWRHRDSKRVWGRAQQSLRHMPSSNGREEQLQTSGRRLQGVCFFHLLSLLPSCCPDQEPQPQAEPRLRALSLHNRNPRPRNRTPPFSQAPTSSLSPSSHVPHALVVPLSPVWSLVPGQGAHGEGLVLDTSHRKRAQRNQ